jgi:hypothetical protein
VVELRIIPYADLVSFDFLARRFIPNIWSLGINAWLLRLLKLTAYSSHILLQFTEHRMHAVQSILVLDPSFITAALQASRVMAWKMLRVATQVIKTESEVRNVPFAALCAVLRGAIVVLETRKDDENVVTEEDLDGLWRVLKWFARRWRIGEKYLARVEQLLQ